MKLPEVVSVGLVGNMKLPEVVPEDEIRGAVRAVIQSREIHNAIRAEILALAMKLLCGRPSPYAVLKVIDEETTHPKVMEST